MKRKDCPPDRRQNGDCVFVTGGGRCRLYEEARALAKRETSHWIPYKNLTDALQDMDKAISAIEGITFRGREEEKRINLALDRIECARGAIETLIPLPLPRWETPEQWEKRTGEAWPDDGAVYFTHNTLDGTNVSWAICTYEKYKHYEKFNPGDGFRGVVTTEAGPPPYGWLPETGAQDD